VIKELNINVEFLTRIEGHGNLVIDVEAGQVNTCEFQVTEAPRFFEAMIRNRSIFEVQHITSRICGICSVAHSLASIKASEKAAGFEPSEQTMMLRKLLLHFEIMDSHLLHAYFLVAPDALGVPSVLPLIETHNGVVKRALRMKKEYSDLCDILAGRHTHPITVCPRGFTKLPTVAEINTMISILEGQIEDLNATVDIFKNLQLPDFERDTEYVALTHPHEYAFLDGDLTTTDLKKTVNPSNYKEVVQEYHVSHSTSKHAKNIRDSYMVGALARININYEMLNDEAKAVARELNFTTPCHNPFMNTVAQVVELAHCLYDSIRILRQLLARGVNYDEVVSSWPRKDELSKFRVNPGTGVAAIEVPRGTLFHEYTIDDKGFIQSANCVIPTNQNLANLDLDLRKMVPEILHKSEEEITLQAEMLVRAYDPCVSCSCHMLNVEFV
jgi:sulfhydrogenase subunit alpha